jgi:hypothetical protein
MLGPLDYHACVIYCAQKDSDWLDAKAHELEELYKHIAVLWHDPNEPRIIKGHPAPSPGVSLLIIQDKERLRQAKAELAKTDYYKQWKY